jgi:hypothetical protein
MGLARRFLHYMFGGADKTVDSNDVIEETSENGNGDSRRPSEEETRNRIIVAINWTMLSILVAGFADIILSSWIRPDARVPDIVQDIVSGAAGYFLSALVSFVRHK